MQKVLCFLLLLVGLLSCTPRAGGVGGTSGKGSIVPYGQATELGPSELLRVGDGDPVLTFVKVVSDSRCPRGTNCVRAGEAIVRVRLADGEEREIVIGTEEGVRQLILPAGKVAILGLDPYPVHRTETTPEAYRLRVIVGAPEKR